MKLDQLRTKPEYLALIDPRAIDGDTIEATILLPLGVMIRRRIRLRDWHAPEHDGRNPDQAHAAQAFLQAALDGHVCHIQCVGLREDVYGRYVTRLLLDGRLARPDDVLHGLALTREQHRAELEFCGRTRSRAKTGL